MFGAAGVSCTVHSAVACPVLTPGAAPISQHHPHVPLGLACYCSALQCLQNDLKKGTCPAHQVVCLVIDECHRATGDAAMAKSLQLLRERRAHFRVLGLSATPGNSHEKIKVGCKGQVTAVMSTAVVQKMWSSSVRHAAA
jgi:hypothetical protein